MKVKLLSTSNNWQAIKNATMNTIGKDTGKYPDELWKRKMLMAEHSPIRKLKVSWKWQDLMFWVSVHFVRHHIGIEHFISTERTDRTGINRNELPQKNFVLHECEANAQAMINVSRKRLCMQASEETREAWKAVLAKTKHYESALVKSCVRDCVYRGYCYEFKSCGYSKTQAYRNELAEYRKYLQEV